jgi:hypothetical protein
MRVRTSFDLRVTELPTRVAFEFAAETSLTLVLRRDDESLVVVRPAIIHIGRKNRFVATIEVTEDRLSVVCAPAGEDPAPQAVVSTVDHAFAPGGRVELLLDDAPSPSPYSPQPTSSYGYYGYGASPAPATGQPYGHATGVHPAPDVYPMAPTTGAGALHIAPNAPSACAQHGITPPQDCPICPLP